MRTPACAILFVGLDMADLATVCALAERALRFLGAGRSGVRRRAWRARGHGAAVGVEAFLFLACKAALLVSFKANELIE
jgi:hypothetical protein